MHVDLDLKTGFSKTCFPHHNECFQFGLKGVTMKGFLFSALGCNGSLMINNIDITKKRKGLGN